MLTLQVVPPDPLLDALFDAIVAGIVFEKGIIVVAQEPSLGVAGIAVQEKAGSAVLAHLLLPVAGDTQSQCRGVVGVLHAIQGVVGHRNVGHALLVAVDVVDDGLGHAPGTGVVQGSGHPVELNTPKSHGRPCPPAGDSLVQFLLREDLL